MIDVSNPASLVYAGSLSGLSSPSQIFVQGRYAYVIENTGGGVLRVIDVSNPSAMVSVTSLVINAYSSVFVQGRFAYAVDFDSTRLQIVDLGGAYVQQLETGGFETATLATRENVAIGNDLDVKGGGTIGRGLQATGNSNVLGDFMVTNTNMVRVGTTGTGLPSHTVYVQANYAYLINYGSPGSLSIMDVSNPRTPTVVGTLSGFTYADSIYVQGRYAYLASAFSTSIWVVDVSNPANPTLKSTFSTGLDSPYGIYVQGRYLYAVCTSSTLLVIDIANPLTPITVGSLSLSALAHSVYVQGRYAYIPITGSAGSGTTMAIVDVSNPTKPTLVGTCASLNGPWSVVVQGRYAYVTNAGNGNGTTLSIVDVSNPASPTIVGTQSGLTGPTSVYAQGKYVYVVNQGFSVGGTSVSIIEVTNPASPTKIGTVTGFTGPQSIFVQGRNAYVTSETPNTLTVVDLGGTYIQQLEAGGIETGTLATRSNTAIGNDLDVKGGVAVGRNFNVQGQITAINASGSTGTATTSPLCLTNLLSSGTFGTNLGVDASGNVGIYTPSSIRFKENITPLTTESDLLYSLTPVKYDYKPEYGGGKGMYGFIAEDVAQVYPSIINYDEAGLIRNYNASTLHAPTIKEVQKQHKLLHAHEATLRDHATSMFDLLHADDSLQTALSLHDARLRSQMTTIQALLVTIASMQSQLQTLQNR